MNLLDAVDDPRLLAHAVRDPATWRAWRVMFAAMLGAPPPTDEADMALYRLCTGRTKWPTKPFRKTWLIIGRRGGKSLAMALQAVFAAVFSDYRPYLGPGEKPTVMLIAADRKQARVAMRYVRGLLEGSPVLAKMIAKVATESIELVNGTVIEVATCSFRTVRGYTIAAMVGDEIAFWADEESASPDSEVIRAVEPAMVTIPNATMLLGSSPYARRGVLYEAHKKYFGVDDAPELVWRAPTRVMNPTVPQSYIDEAYAADPASAAAEYGAEFRADVESFISRAVVEQAVEPGCFERPFRPEIQYAAFVDPSGGSADSMTLGISHQTEDGDIVLDVIRERKPPFSPDSVVEEFAELLKGYGLYTVRGDAYSGQWVRERFMQHGVTYELADRPKSRLYGEMLPLLMGGRITLLDNPRLVNQIASLERRVARGGRDSIDHPPGAGSHDDLANAAAGAIVMSEYRAVSMFDVL